MKADARRTKKSRSKPTESKARKSDVLKVSSNLNARLDSNEADDKKNSYDYKKLNGTLSNKKSLHIALSEGRATIKMNKQEVPIHKVSFDDKIEIIEHGITKNDVLRLKDRYDLNYPAFAKILDITERTIQNKSNGYLFKGAVAEKILALSGLYSYGLEVFEDEKKFINWLNRGNSIFGNKKPIDLLSTIVGIEEVKHEVGRIDYGVY